MINLLIINSLEAAVGARCELCCWGGGPEHMLFGGCGGIGVKVGGAALVFFSTYNDAPGSSTTATWLMKTAFICFGNLGGGAAGHMYAGSAGAFC